MEEKKTGSADKKSFEMSDSEKSIRFKKAYMTCLGVYVFSLAILSDITNDFGVAKGIPKGISFLVGMTIVIVLAQFTARKIYSNKFFGDK